LEADLQLFITGGVLVLCAALATRTLVVPLMVISGFLAIMIPVLYGISVWSVSSSGIAFLLFLIIFFVAIKKNVFVIDRAYEIKLWRIIARPFALLFIPIRLLTGQRFLLYLLGGLCIIFILMDLYRLFSKQKMTLLFKKSEFQRFSSMTSFLVAVFIIFLLFHTEISYLCLTFIIFGDLTAKMTGYCFGRMQIIHGKTLEGSLGFLTGCLFSGFIIVPYSIRIPGHRRPVRHFYRTALTPDG
jgi:dolichol kinase